MSFLVRNTTGSPGIDIILNDLGLTIAAGTDFDMRSEQANDVAESSDLTAAISAGNLIVLDPLDGTTPLTIAQSIEIVQVHNDPHYRIRGGELNQLDDVDTTGLSNGDVLQYSSGSPQMWASVSAGTLAGDIRLDDLQDVNTPGLWTDGEVYVLVGNASNEVTATPIVAGGSPGSVPTGFCEVVQDIVGQTVTSGSQSDITVTYTDGAGQCDGVINFSVDDVFLRNTGDVLESGTLEIAPGASLTIKGATGSPSQEGSLVIEQDAIATIVTPTAGFSADNQLVNKGYVDSVAQGLDWKDSVRASTTADVSGGSPSLYNPNGGTGGTGNFVGIDLTSDAIWDGVPTAIGGFSAGDRLLVKNEGDAQRNGIYVVVSLGGSPAGSNSTIERASDHDGSPSNEVSAGNTVFVENGDDNLNSQWSIVGDGILTLNTDDIDWTKTGGAVSILANEGLNSVGNRFNLDISALTGTITPALGDFVAFHDINAGGSPTDTDTRKSTIQDMFNALDVPYSVTGTGFIARTADDTYSTYTITAAGPGDRDGIEVLNGGGGATPVIGLDIENLPAVAGSPVVDPDDRVPVYDVDTDSNVYYTVSQIATALSSTSSYTVWQTDGTGGPIGPASSSDTVNLNEGIGIDITMSSGPDIVEFAFSRNGMADTAVELTDTFPFFDGSNSNEPEYRSFQDLLNDLDVPNGITGTGIVVRTAGSPETYTSRSIVASTNEDKLGADVVNGDGTAGNIEVGVTIDTVTSAPADMDATDEFLVHDKSEGTGGANRSMTGQQVADGVAGLLGLDIVSVETVGGTGSPGEKQLFILDPTTSEKLSVAEVTMTFSDNYLSDSSWLEIGNAVDALTGYIIPMDAKLVRVSAHCADKNGAGAKDIDLYKNGAKFADPLFTFSAGTGEKTYYDASVNYDFAAGDKVRLRSAETGGSLDDTVVTLWFRWRTV